MNTVCYDHQPIYVLIFFLIVDVFNNHITAKICEPLCYYLPEQNQINIHGNIIAKRLTKTQPTKNTS